MSAWIYLKHDEEGCLVYDQRDKLPPKGSAFLAFDTFRWKVQLGFREDLGCISILNPNVCDDCNVIAWAPLGTNEEPDEIQIRAHCHEIWHNAINSNYAENGIDLIRYGR